MPNLPHPVVEYAVWDGQRLYLPYPGSYSTGSKEAADSTVAPNKQLGWKTVRCTLVPVRFEDIDV